MGKEDSYVAEMEAELGLDGLGGMGGILDDVWGAVKKVKDKAITNIKDKLAARVGYQRAGKGQAPSLPSPRAPVTRPPPMPPAFDIKKIAMIGVPVIAAAFMFLKK